MRYLCIMSVSLVGLRKFGRTLDFQNTLVAVCVCLLFTMYGFIMRLVHHPLPIESFFEPVMTGVEKELFIKTLKAVTDALDAHNLTYMMYGGTLLGSMRHHGFIPWDDDVDLLLNASQKPLVAKALTRMEPEYKLNTYGSDISQEKIWKFYHHSAQGYMFFDLKWPYVDMNFFQEDDDEIWDLSVHDNPRLYKKDMFPLTRRPFEEFRLWAPCNPYKYTDAKLNMSQCRALQFSHKMEIPMMTYSFKDVPCSRLAGRFPFVERKFNKGNVKETLVLGKQILHSVLLPEPCSIDHL